MENRAKFLLTDAVSRRRSMVSAWDGHTTAWRMIHSSGDGFYGLTVDRLGDVLLLEQHRADANPKPLLDALHEYFGEECSLFFKERWSGDQYRRAGRQLLGPPCSPNFCVLENSIKFNLRLCDEEHIGLFLDSRPARERIRQLSAGKRVLNLFSYTGGFGLAAAAGGARSTINIDNKRSAVTIAEQNYRTNEMPFDTRSFYKTDAIAYLQRAAKGRGRYDLIVVDPPPRFKQRKRRDFDATRDFGRLLSRCIQVASPGALILAGLNALRVGDDLFEQQLAEAGGLSGKTLRVVERIGSGMDFPPCDDRPVARFCLLEIL